MSRYYNCIYVVRMLATCGVLLWQLYWLCMLRAGSKRIFVYRYYRASQLWSFIR